MQTAKIKTEHFDIAVIGGGAAGMLAAICASEGGKKVALIEKNNSLGKKLLLTGNGRCNLTQANFSKSDFIGKLGKNGRFLFSALAAFGPHETMDFFEDLGIRLKTEKDGRVFPASNKARDVLDVLEKALKRNKVKIMLGRNVIGLEMKDGKIDYINVVETQLIASPHCNASLRKEKIQAANFILSTGGKSYPATGSTGDGYSWLAAIGHTLVSTAPALVPVRTKETWVKDLQGISLADAGIYLVRNNRRINLGIGEIIFTHFGISGPAIINASKFIGEHLGDDKVFLELDLLPALDISELEKKFKTDLDRHKKKDLKNYLGEYFPQKLAEKIMELAGIEKDRKIHSVTRAERTDLIRLMKNLRLTVASLLDFNQAMVTRGGASLKEVDPQTMRSKIVKNLFLAGEVLDLDGPTGGYNLQIAWTTGHASGQSAAENFDKHPE
ncbi:MAG: NAD(P)/FAD-dependent oxidoreductase [Candidatus Pacebacteria bacterium]|nr:NAD(P)/FAD-dependent oxidoreductase [Candidatus Paceibacterota bacterium]